MDPGAGAPEGTKFLELRPPVRGALDRLDHQALQRELRAPGGTGSDSWRRGGGVKR